MPERLQAIEDHLISHGLDGLLDRREAPPPPRISSASIVRLSRRAGRGEQRLPPDRSRYADEPRTLEAAAHAAGAAVAATDAVIAGELENAFCCVRPPGHHAEPDRAMGFCFYNNVAIAARHALEAHGLERVAIVDFDVHHGNGTEAAFRGERRVLMCSFFQHPFYPYSGAETIAPNMSNIRCRPTRTAWRCARWPRRSGCPGWRSSPQMLFISAGFDAHREDDMGQMGTVEQDYARITERLLEVARRHAQGRIVSCLEGATT